jgi:ubiquitin-protein ligase
MQVITTNAEKSIKKQKTPPAGITIDFEITNLQRWLLTLHGAQGTLYAGEKFYLQFTFPEQYPLEAPEVPSYITEVDLRN